MPRRIQRSRARGWRMPEGAVYVGRPTVFGNPFEMTAETDRAVVVAKYRALVEAMHHDPGPLGTNFRAALAGLRGKDLACWCPLDRPCHADVLLDVANRPRCEAVP